MYLYVYKIYMHTYYITDKQKNIRKKKKKKKTGKDMKEKTEKKKENRTPARPVRRLLSTRDICPVTRGRRSATSRLLAISPTTRGCNMAKDKRTTLHARTWYATTHIVVGATQNLNGFAIKHWI